MTDEQNEASMKTFNKLMSMPQEEFDKFIDDHMDGDIAKLLLAGGYAFLGQKEE